MSEKVCIGGFVDNIKDKWKLAFVTINSQEWYKQLVLTNNIKEQLKNITLWSYVNVSGLMVDNPNIKDERFNQQEIQVDSIVLNTKADILPVLQTTSTMEAARDYRHLQLRDPKYKLIMEMNHRSQMAMREYRDKKWFLEINTPKIMGTASEWWAEVFEIQFYDSKAYLAQSPQFYKQMAMGAAMRNVFEIAPAFRADPSKTSRHTSEFLSVDMEMADITSHYDIMKFQEEWLIHVITTMKETLWDKVNSLYDGLNIDIPKAPFPKIPLNEAKKILVDKYNHHMAPDKDIDPEWERLICQHVKETYDSDFVYIIDYPAEFRPFYHMRDEKTGLTKSFDLLYKWLEISTGAQREHRLDILKDQAKTSVKSVPLEQIESYLSYFQYGMPPHGWFGLGQERLIKQLLEKETIKDIPFLYVSKDRLP